jgi:signal transduction histidine kinase
VNAGWQPGLPQSIKGRLVGLFLLLALCTSVVFLMGMQRLLHNGWEGYAKPMVADYVDRLALEIGSPPDPARAMSLAQRLPISVRIEGPLVQFDSRPPRGRRATPEALEARDETAAGWGLVRSTADGHRISFGLARPPSAMRSRLVGWATLLALLGLTAIAYLAVRRLLAPLDAITVGVQAYGRGEFAAPIPVPRRDELGRLAEQINLMASNLSGMLEAKRALLLAISHELRSPLTRARVNAELVDDGEARQALLRDLGEMRDLITSLLESERLAQGHAALHAEPTDLAALARQVAAAVPDAAPPALHLKLDERIGPVRVDPTRMTLLLRNLIANALRHSVGAGAPPEVFLVREADGRIALGVRDHGPGVDEDQLSQLGQAFHRPETARTRATGGVGLGLYLCRLVAQAHGGELRLRRAEPGLEVAAVWAPQGD